MTNTDTAVASRHQLNIQAKALRALVAITHLAEHSIVPDPQRPGQNDVTQALIYLERMLFGEGTDDATRGQWWLAVGMQDALLHGCKTGATTFTTSRPFIAMALRVRIETLQLADPFDGLF